MKKGGGTRETTLADLKRLRLLAGLQNLKSYQRVKKEEFSLQYL